MADDESTVAAATLRDGPGRSVVKPLSRGDVVGRYVIEDRLGEGGMGVVTPLIEQSGQFVTERQEPEADRF